MSIAEQVKSVMERMGIARVLARFPPPPPNTQPDHGNEALQSHPVKP